MLRDFFRDDAAARAEIAAWAKQEALSRWRHPGVLRILLDSGTVRADLDLLSVYLTFDGACASYLRECHCPRARIDLFLCLRLILGRISSAIGGAAAGTNNLAAVVDAVQEGGGPISGRRSFVLLLLYHGARGPGHLLRAVRDAAGDRRYGGLMDDVLEVAGWKRWIGRRSIGGLTPEIAQDIMFRTWIEMLR